MILQPLEVTENEEISNTGCCRKSVLRNFEISMLELLNVNFRNTYFRAPLFDFFLLSFFEFFLIIKLKKSSSASICQEPLHYFQKKKKKKFKN